MTEIRNLFHKEERTKRQTLRNSREDNARRSIR